MNPLPEHAPGQPCRVTGGRYNGLAGTIRWMGDVWCSLVVIYEGKPIELIEELRHLAPIQPTT